VVDGHRRQTYAELDGRSSRLATALRAHGLQTGDRVAVLMGNQLEYLETASAVAKAGMVMVPVNPRSTRLEAEAILQHSGAAGLIFADALGTALPSNAEDLGVLACVGGATAGVGYDDLVASGEPRDPFIAVDEREPFCIAYTSGTTGKPKGVVISHRSRTLTFYFSALQWGFLAGDVQLGVAPLYHGAGFAFAYASIVTGGTLALLRSWDPEHMLALAERERAVASFLVPTHAQTLRSLGDAAIAAHDLSALRTLYFNAAALPMPLKEWVMERFQAAGVHELYGSTEAGVVTDLPPADALRKPGSVGPAWFATELRLVDDDGSPVAPGEPGELLSRSPFLMNGYYRDPAATAACTTEDGFLSAGDVAVADDEGFIWIVDRKKDMIVSGGVNVFPREIEDVLVQCPGVAEAAVVGSSHETWGEQVVAFVVAAPGADLDLAAVEVAVTDRLSDYKRPREWHVVETLPRNAAGKVLKRELQASLRPAPP
jgi:acyl-CoA synthetase (AMP-forming)/AMP-acid ligase II